MADQPLKVETIALVGGLSDSKATPEPSDLVNLSNMVPLRGRFALRAPLTEAVQLYSLIADEGGSGAAVDAILGLCYHNGFLYAVAWRHGGVHKVYLYKLNSDGTPVTGSSPVQPVATVWGTAATCPKVSMCSMQGGTADVNVDRLYISEVDQQQDTRYWNGTAMADVEQDLDDNASTEHLRFGLVFPYQYHLWGTRYYSGTNTDRAEIIRFSRPGLIAEDEPNVANDVTREWWSIDFRPFGRRGDPATAYGYAGGSAIIFKRYETWALYGYDSESWAIKQLSGNVGAVGHKAVCWTEDGLCFFWSDRGPHVCDGINPPSDIGGDIRGLILGLTFSKEVTAAYSPDDGLVYFVVPVEGSADNAAPNLYLVFDKKEKRWARGQWLVGSAAALKVGALAAVPRETLPVPAGAPILTSATALSATLIRLVWVNADTAAGTTTQVYRHTTTFTPPTGTLVATAASGVATVDDTACPASKTTYHYKTRHMRSGTASTASNEEDAKTWLKEPTGLTATGDSAGVDLAFTNNEDGADILIYRKTTGVYALLDTMAAQAAGALAYADNTGTPGVTYTYRLTALKAGETTSEYSTEVSARTVIELTSVSHTATVGVDCPAGNNLRVDWTSAGGAIGDTASIYVKQDGGAWVLKASDVALAAGAYTGLYFLRKLGAVNYALQVRVEAYGGGTTLQDTADSVESTETVNATPCDEV